MKPLTRTLAQLGAATCALLVAMPGAASAASKGETALAGSPSPTASDGQTAFRYRLRALGASAGEAVMTVSEPRRVGKMSLRSVRLEARTSGLAGRVYSALGDGTSWVDEAWLPVRSAWSSVIKGGARHAESKYQPNRITGEYEREGKPTRKIDDRVPGRATDIVSAFIWLVHQPMEPGHAIDKRLHDGNRTYRLVGEVGERSRITVPLGVRDVWPIHMRLERNHKVVRHVTYWVGADDRMPYKVSFDYGALGTIDVELVGHRTLPAAAKQAAR